MSETELGTFTEIAGKHHGRPNGRLIRTRDFKYMVYSRGTNREQLFNMNDDPLEMRNLAMDPINADVLDRHRDILAQWIVETGDDFDSGRKPGRQ